MGLLDKLFGKEVAAAPVALPKSHRVFEVYEDAGGKWRWRVLAENGSIVGTSGESFATKGNAERAANHEASFYAGGVAFVIVETK